jgi:hypothetical protein
MNSAVDLSTNSRAEEARSQNTVYLWIGLALFGLALIGGVAGSHYANAVEAPYVGP